MNRLHQIRFDPSSGRLLLSVFRPISPPYKHRQGTVCDAAERWAAVETGQRTDQVTVDGNFDRYRIPVGFGLGQSFRLSESIDLYPFVTSTLVLEHERFERRHDVFQLKTRPALGTEAGLGITMGRIMLRSTVSHVWTSRNALTGQHNFPYLSAHVGFVF